ncbi:MAG TPA: nuclear transport factor 2 family protein [Pyrinomonadaceae bacterium]|jgi:hypothetical protein
MDEAELIEINERIGDAEQNADAGFLRRALADELVFRRASGKIVTKDEFLADLPNNRFERKSRALQVTLHGDGKTALVSVIVAALDKEFQNLRVFVRREGGWQCIVWFNTKLN